MGHNHYILPTRLFRVLLFCQICISEHAVVVANDTPFPTSFAVNTPDCTFGMKMSDFLFSTGLSTRFTASRVSSCALWNRPHHFCRRLRHWKILPTIKQRRISEAVWKNVRCVQRKPLSRWKSQGCVQTIFAPSRLSQAPPLQKTVAVTLISSGTVMSNSLHSDFLESFSTADSCNTREHLLSISHWMNRLYLSTTMHAIAVANDRIWISIITCHGFEKRSPEHSTMQQFSAPAVSSGSTQAHTIHNKHVLSIGKYTIFFIMFVQNRCLPKTSCCAF